MVWVRVKLILGLRADLRADLRATRFGNEVLVYWNKPGYAGWYLGTLIAYDSNTSKHTIKWDDGDRDWHVDLMACSKCKEWRFVQSGEDVNAFLDEE